MPVTILRVVIWENSFLWGIWQWRTWLIDMNSFAKNPVTPGMRRFSRHVTFFLPWRHICTNVPFVHHESNLLSDSLRISDESFSFSDESFSESISHESLQMLLFWLHTYDPETAHTVILAQRDRSREGLMSNRTYVYEAHDSFTQLYTRLIHSGSNKRTLGRPKLNWWMNSGPKIPRSYLLHYWFTQRTQLIHTARMWMIHAVHTTDSNSAYDWFHVARTTNTHSTNVTDWHSANVTDSHSAHASFT